MIRERKRSLEAKAIMDQAQAIKRERARAVHKGESERAIVPAEYLVWGERREGREGGKGQRRYKYRIFGV